MLILSGKELKEKLAQTIKEELKDISLEFYLYSNKEDFPSQAYLRGIKKTLDFFDVKYTEGYIDLSKTEEENLSIFKKESLNKHILMARPLGVKYESKFLSLIPSNYDPDMLTTYNRGKLFGGDLNYLTATSQSVKYILESYNIEIENKKVLVLGRSTEVGYPCFQLLNKKNATVSLAHSKTSKEILDNLVETSDIIILATGKPGLIDRNKLNKNQIIIDCGFNPHGGDLGFVPEEDELKAYTPVPGGVGALTSYCLLRNAIYLEKNK